MVDIATQRKDKRMIVARKYLEEYGIRPSVQRIAVMHYLLTHRTHPTVDEIYSALVSEMPTLSRTTIYNTLHTLTQSGAILMLDIDSMNTRYDGYTSPHAHFMCSCCGKVYDVDIDDAGFIGRNSPKCAASLSDAQLYYKGICNQCAKREN